MAFLKTNKPPLESMNVCALKVRVMVRLTNVRAIEQIDLKNVDLVQLGIYRHEVYS